MPGKGHVREREVVSDPVYDDKTVTKLISSIMLDGKKGTTQKIVHGTFDAIKEATGEDVLEVFYKAMNNIMPILKVKTREIGGANYQVPIKVRPERRRTLGLRWLTTYAKARGEKTVAEKLTKEIMDTANNAGASVKKREDVHKMVEANRASAHYGY